MLNFEEVPNDILTGKDLDYLSDMFGWNYSVLKKTNTALGIVGVEDIIEVLSKGYNLFNDNLKYILLFLESRGNVNE